MSPSKVERSQGFKSHPAHGPQPRPGWGFPFVDEGLFKRRTRPKSALFPITQMAEALALFALRALLSGWSAAAALSAPASKPTQNPHPI